MNKVFINKMLQAKRLEYQALKEVMPDCMLKRITKLENELMDLGKELMMSVLSDGEEAGKSSAPKHNSGSRKVTIE